MADQEQDMQDTSSASETETKQDDHRLLKIIAIIALAGFGLFAFSAIRNHAQAPKPATVSGIIDFSGLTPTGQDATARVSVWQREQNTGDFQDTGVQVQLQDNALWSWDGATEGVVYEFKALATARDRTIKESPVVVASAPGSDVVLELDITWDDIPDEIAQDYPVPVSGRVTVNGYVPAGAKVIGWGRRSGTENEFTQGLSRDASQNVDWQYDQALNGRAYDFKATLVDQYGYLIGESDVITKTAPFTDGNLTINSDAMPAPEITSISGIVRINGSIPDGSDVDIHIRKPSADYMTVATIKAETNTYWEWNEAQAGVTYDVKAVLDTPSAEDPQGHPQTVTAPAKDLILTVDSGSAMGAPDDAPELSECYKEDDLWKAVLVYDGVDGAKNYWIEVGTEEGENDILNEKQVAPADASDLEVEVNVKENHVSFFSRYAYNQCESCGDDSYSDWSDTLEFECDEED